MTRTLVLALPALISLQAAAGGLADFLDRLDLNARVDRRGFSAQLGSQFQVDAAEVQSTLGSVQRPADAFMVFQLARMTGKPPADVLKAYRNDQAKDWEARARALGLEPGSPEFLALKEGDFQFGMIKGKPKPPGNG